jgi:hypothetical protein
MGEARFAPGTGSVHRAKINLLRDIQRNAVDLPSKKGGAFSPRRFNGK